MLPVALNISHLPMGLAGHGAAFTKRLRQLRKLGVEHLQVFYEGTDEEILELAGSGLITRLPLARDMKELRVLMVVGLDDVASEEIAQQARLEGLLVNVEDVPHLCDFYFMSLVNRGDLQLAISTKGKSPAMAVALREYLEARMDDTWGEHLDEIAAKRLAWKAEGISGKEIMLRSRSYIYEQGWLPAIPSSPLAGENDESQRDETGKERPYSPPHPTSPSHGKREKDAT